MTEQEAFEDWLANVPREEVTSWQDVWRDACAWQREQLRYVEAVEIAAAIHNQGEKND